MHLDERWLTTQLQENKIRTKLAAGRIAGAYPIIPSDEKHVLSARRVECASLKAKRSPSAIGQPSRLLPERPYRAST